MAIFKSASMTSASGSVGGMTYSHNRSGMYMRARRIPVNPNSTDQQTIRNALAASSAAWRALDEAQRVAWAAYAAATPVLNPLGDTIFLTGQQQYVASNSFAQQGGQGANAFPDAPTIPGRVAIGGLTVVIDASATTIVVNNVAADVSNVSVFVGDPQSAGVTFFKGPFQIRGTDAPAMGTVTLTGTGGRNGLVFVAGQRIPVRVRGIAADGRLSTVFETIVEVVA